MGQWPGSRPAWAAVSAAYAQQWEIEITFDELKTHQRGPRAVLRSKSPDLINRRSGPLCCHYAIRTSMGGREVLRRCLGRVEDGGE